MIELKLLGSNHLEYRGQLVTGPAAQRQRLAVLSLIGAEGGRVSRSFLLSMLWPETTEARGRHALANALYALRTELGKAAIRTRGEHVSLELSHVSVDVLEFDRHFASGAFAEAVSVYEGPFLDGFSAGGVEFERWAEQMRARYADRYRVACDHLATAASLDARPREAAYWWRTLLAEDPLSTAGTVGLVRAMMAAGEVALALSATVSYRTRLERELGISPPPEILQLEATLRSTLSQAHGPIPTVDLRSHSAPRGPATAAVRHVKNKPHRTRALLFGALATAGIVLMALRLSPSIAEPAQPDQSATVKPAAQEAYNRGLFLMRQLTPATMQSAIAEFETAVRLDSSYAAPKGSMAMAYWLLAQPLDAMKSSVGMEHARMWAERALVEDAKTVDALAALGWVNLFYDRDLRRAETYFLRTIEVSPTFAPAHNGLSFVQIVVGDTLGALASARRAAELNPFDLSFRAAHAEVLYYARDYAQAHLELDELARLDPGFQRGYQVRSWVLEAEERWLEAAEARTLAGLATQVPNELVDSREAYWAWRLRELGPPTTLPDPNSAIRAWSHAEAGNPDEAFRWLTRALDERSGQVVFLGVQPAWDSLRADPRFPSVLRRSGVALGAT